MTEKEKIFKDLFIHWDSNLWYAVYVFLGIEIALIVAFTQVFITPNLSKKDSILQLIAISGLILSILWLFILPRKLSYSLGVFELIKGSYTELKVKIKDERKKKRFILVSWASSAYIVTVVIPILFLAFWGYLLKIICCV